MFEKHREREAQEARREAVQTWQSRRDAYVEMIDTAKNFAGTSAEGLLLAAGERVFLTITDTSLIEERRGRGTYQGHSQGISVPVMKVGGRQIRYRVGASKGHFVQGDLSPTAIDTGTTYITSSRVIFRGANQTRECAFAKMIGFEHASDTGTTVISVSNRMKPTTIEYGPKASATFEFRLDLALAHFGSTLDELVSELEDDLVAIDDERPEGEETPGDPTSAAGGPTTPGEPEAPGAGGPTAPGEPEAPVLAAMPPVTQLAPVMQLASVGSTPVVPITSPAPSPAQGWFPDPWGTAPLRWWDGSAWSWQTVDPAVPPVSSV